MKADTTSRKSPTPKGVKSTTTTKTAKSKDLATEVVKAAMADAKAGKQAPTQEELLKKAIARRNKFTNSLIREFKKNRRNDVKSHMKTLKKGLGDGFYADLVQEHWVALTMGIKMAGDCYIEQTTLKGEDGQTRTLDTFHMCEWVAAEKVTEIGRKITLKGYRYKNEPITPINSVKELTISREVVLKHETITKVIDGEEYSRTIEHKGMRSFRPVEVLTITDGEFLKRLKIAFETEFPNGFPEESK